MAMADTCGSKVMLFGLAVKDDLSIYWEIEVLLRVCLYFRWNRVFSVNNNNNNSSSMTKGPADVKQR